MNQYSPDLSFKRGFEYTRKSIGEICYPGVGRPSGGNWDTGYTSVGNNLIIFMNIGVPGRTGHDFDNYFDEQNNTITWFGKPKSHSKQPTFKKLLSGETTPHFFARWDSKKPEFIYLGVGSIIKYEDQVRTKDGLTIKLTLTCDDAKNIIGFSVPSENKSFFPNEDTTIPPSSFVMEKHLEDFMFKNWRSTIFGNNYNIYENGRQFQTDTGPLDILAIRNDKKEFLVLELKRDKASDIVVGQTLRYMGYIKNNIATNNEKVRGCIIATEEDQGLTNALSVTPDIDFYKYQINFSLNKVQNRY